MTELVSFPSTSSRHALPLLFAGQVQKEFFVNEALARLDIMLHPNVAGESLLPPESPMEGECWLVASGAGGEWTGHDDSIAGWDGQQWTFCAPVDGMRAHDLATGAALVYDGGWLRTSRPAAPSGGATIDTEAREAITAIIDILATLLFIPAE